MLEQIICKKGTFEMFIWWYNKRILYYSQNRTFKLETIYESQVFV